MASTNEFLSDVSTKFWTPIILKSVLFRLYEGVDMIMDYSI